MIFLSPGFCADGNNMLAGRHTWFSKKLHGLQWRKIKPELRKKMYPECAKRKKNHYHFTKKFISVKRFAVFLFHEKRFYKLRILAHLSNVSCGNLSGTEKADNLPFTRLVFNYSQKFNISASEFIRIFVLSIFFFLFSCFSCTN